MSKLALYGGKSIRNKPFPKRNVIGTEEKRAINRVMDSGVLSEYLGEPHAAFYGGREVRALEDEWAGYFNVKHAIAVNSATSGLYCAVGASGVDVGEEVIVSPCTMSASAVAPLVYNALPVFADIEKDFYCLDVRSIEQRITERTRAIIVVDIFGLPYDADAVNQLAQKHNLLVIEDAAQAPGALYKGKYAGTLGDIGVYSLNYHKHIHCGEGGIIVTNNDDIAEHMRLIRNHGEVIASARNVSWSNMIGFNYRMTELQAAIAREQLKKLKNVITERQERAQYLDQHCNSEYCRPAQVRSHSTHAYYAYPLSYIGDVSKRIFVDAVKAELGLDERDAVCMWMTADYGHPLYMQNIYAKKNVYGKSHFPWNMRKQSLSYDAGTCPTAEKLFYNELIVHNFIEEHMTQEDLKDVVNAFNKVWENRDELKEVKIPKSGFSTKVFNLQE